MGQDQSSHAGNSSPTPSTGSASAPSSSFSFLTRKRTATKIPQIVTVNNNNNTSTSAEKIDEELKHIKEIPRFMPILRGVLASQRTPPEIYKKIEPKYIFRFLQRLQQHFADCQQVVGMEQTAVCAQITEVDQFASYLVRGISNRSKQCDKFAKDIHKTSAVINEQMEKVQLQLQTIIHGLDALNEMLPADERLPPISVQMEPSPLRAVASENRILPAEECTVVDIAVHVDEDEDDDDGVNIAGNRTR